MKAAGILFLVYLVHFAKEMVVKKVEIEKLLEERLRAVEDFCRTTASSEFCKRDQSSLWARAFSATLESEVDYLLYGECQGYSWCKAYKQLLIGNILAIVVVFLCLLFVTAAIIAVYEYVGKRFWFND